MPFKDEPDYTLAAMAVVACSGFPVPVSRYFREFEGVEISETELGIPGAGTVRRWLREAPEGFTFSLLAPKDIANAGYVLNPATEKLVKEVGQLSKSMKAEAVVFAAPPEFGPTRPNKTALKKFVEALPARYPRVVLSMQGWKHSDVLAAIDGKKNVVRPTTRSRTIRLRARRTSPTCAFPAPRDTAPATTRAPSSASWRT